jgi:hypothetical protein
MLGMVQTLRGRKGNTGFRNTAHGTPTSSPASAAPLAGIQLSI